MNNQAEKINVDVPDEKQNPISIENKPIPLQETRGFGEMVQQNLERLRTWVADIRARWQKGDTYEPEEAEILAKNILSELAEPPKNENILASVATEKTTVEEDQSLPEYVKKIVQKIDNESAKNYEEFFASEHIRRMISISVQKTAEMQVLAELIPELKQNAEKLIPYYSDVKRVIPEEGVSNYEMAYLKTNAELLREDEKSEERQRLISKVFANMGKYKLESGKFITKGEFEQLVYKRSDELADKLITTARAKAENIESEGNVLIVSTTKKGLDRLLEQEEYQPLLDSIKFSQAEFNNIQNALNIKPDDSMFEFRFSGMSKEAIRYCREVELGIYPRSGYGNNIKHPVYAEMVVDPDVEIAKMEGRGYGNIRMKYKTENIGNRVVFATDDTVGFISRNHQLNWKAAARVRGFLNALEENSFVDRTMTIEYVEAHIMGGVQLEDFEEITITPDDENAEIINKFMQDKERFEVEKQDDGKLVIKIK